MWQEPTTVHCLTKLFLLISAKPSKHTKPKKQEPVKQTSKSHKHGRILTLGLTCAVFALAGCASIVSGTKQKVIITSVPDAADVKIERVTLATNSTEWEGKTPATVKLARKGHYLVTVSMKGYQKIEIPVEDGGMNGWVWGNLALGGIIGMIIDVTDGAAKNLSPDEINVKLVAIQKSTQNNRRDQVYAMIYTKGRDGRIQGRGFPLKPIERN